MVSIPSLTAVTTAAATDRVVVEVAAGTRTMTRTNLMLRLSELSVLTPANINLASDRIGLWDSTDGLLKSLTAFDVLFGNFTNLQLNDTFDLDPAIHNIRPIELIDPFTTTNITISSNTSGIGGASFNLFNFSPSDITVTGIDGMVIFSNGVSASPVTIRRDTAATIQVADNGNECIFSGG